jgi:hypothetical protein
LEKIPTSSPQLATRCVDVDCLRCRRNNQTNIRTPVAALLLPVDINICIEAR